MAASVACSTASSRTSGAAGTVCGQSAAKRGRGLRGGDAQRLERSALGLVGGGDAGDSSIGQVRELVRLLSAA